MDELEGLSQSGFAKERSVADEPVLTASTRKETSRQQSTSLHRPIRFGPTEITYKDKTGTWLSPIAQEDAKQGLVPPEPKAPGDARHRKFIAALAKCIDSIVEESKISFGEPLEDTFKASNFIPRQKDSRKVDSFTLNSSIRNCPVTVPIEIAEASVFTSLHTSEKNTPKSGGILYTWIEQGWIRHGRMQMERSFVVQVRNHTKLERFHEVRRPVYCVNLKTAGGDLLDLRVMAIVKSEMRFLEAAAQVFAKGIDAFEGRPVVDHAGRVLLDERIVRRAAYEYSKYQQSVLESGELYAATSELDLHVRAAHFIVMRAHLPTIELGGGPCGDGKGVSE